MPDGASESAVVVRVPVPPAVERLRRRWDWAAQWGVPAHVTILYPFVPAGDLDASVRRSLAGIAAEHRPFDVRFDRVGRFPTAVYLAPDPPEPFNRLTEAIHSRFPDYPPYEGAFEVVIPHLTVAESIEAPLDEVATVAETALPFSYHVTRLEVLVQGPDDRWLTRWRLRLGREL
jgi:2'-5' RNA ligase